MLFFGNESDESGIESREHLVHGSGFFNQRPYVHIDIFPKEVEEIGGETVWAWGFSCLELGHSLVHFLHLNCLEQHLVVLLSN